jgi:hypothetical protein
MKGEYRARTLAVGIMAAGADFLLRILLRPRTLAGDGISSPLEKIKRMGVINLFQCCGRGRPGGDCAKHEKMDTLSAGLSSTTGPRFTWFYGPYMEARLKSMRDEIRMIKRQALPWNGAYGARAGGPINPAPFVLVGPPEKWIGLDTEK